MDNGLPHDVGITFPAKYDGRCKECDADVYEGDPLAAVDGVFVCGDCTEAANRENRAAIRAEIDAQQEQFRAEQPERAARMEAAAKHWLDRVRERAAQEPGREWVTSPEGTGWVRNAEHVPAVCPRCNLTVPCECEPEPPAEQAEQEAPVAVEPGIQALMAAGLLEGQQAGGSGVCVAEIHAAGKVTEVEIPVPVEPQGPSVSSAEAPAPAAVRLDQLAAAAADWTPEQAQADALQASLQSAVDAGTLTAETAASLGWVAPVGTTMTVGGMEFTKHSETPWDTYHSAINELGGEWPPPSSVQPEPAVLQEGRLAEVSLVAPETVPAAQRVAVESPRIQEAREQFRRDPERAPADIFLGALAAATSAAEEQAILDTLDALPAYVGRDSMDAEKRDLLAVITGAIQNHPRSLQVKIGPSEIGTECDHCLAAKLAGWEETERGDAWLPTVGTAVHSWLEEQFRNHPEGPNGSRRFLVETRVAVGAIDGDEITGSTDLADVVAGWTWDWKVVGPTTLKSAKVRPSTQYVVQQMLYARGWNRLGVKITHVGIAYLPRNAMSLASAVWWSAPYDPAIAEAALDRATSMARNVKAMAALGPEIRDKYITSLDRWRQYQDIGPGGTMVTMTGNAQEGKIVCHDCARYPDYPNGDPAPSAEDQLDGLM